MQKVPVLWRDCFSSSAQTSGQQWHGDPLSVVVWVLFLATDLFFRSFSIFTFSFFFVRPLLFWFEFICFIFDSRIYVLLGSDPWYPAAGVSACALKDAAAVTRSSFMTPGPQLSPWGHVAVSPHCGFFSPVWSTLMRLYRGPRLGKMLEAATSVSFSQDHQPPPSPTSTSCSNIEARALE